MVLKGTEKWCSLADNGVRSENPSMYGTWGHGQTIHFAVQFGGLGDGNIWAEQSQIKYKHKQDWCDPRETFKIKQPMSQHPVHIQIANGRTAHECLSLTNCRYICESYRALTCFFLLVKCVKIGWIHLVLQITYCILQIWWNGHQASKNFCSAKGCVKFRI